MPNRLTGIKTHRQTGTKTACKYPAVMLILSGSEPVWRNGRRDRLKICYSKGCASSSLATGIKLYEEFMQFF